MRNGGGGGGGRVSKFSPSLSGFKISINFIYIYIYKRGTGRGNTKQVIVLGGG